MKKMILFFLVLILIIAGFVLSSIYAKKQNTQQNNQEDINAIKQELDESLQNQDDNTQSDNMQIANPASVYCNEQAGKSEMRTDENGGVIGYCVFENGKECEEWAFYRGECKIEN